MRVFVLQPDTTRTSDPAKRSYSFRTGGRTVQWPMEGGQNLGAVGAWNFLFRLGLRPLWLGASRLHEASAGDVVVAMGNGALPNAVSEALIQACGRGATVIGSGAIECWRPLLPEGTRGQTVLCEFPRAALAWIVDGHPAHVIAPPRWPYARFASASGVDRVGTLAAIRGERQTPARALVTPLEDAPAIVGAGRFWFLNGDPFGAFQAWLQGQESIEPWLQWRHRLFWLDELVSELARILNRLDILPAPVPHSAAGTTIVLRHDLDYSRDRSYLDLEREEGFRSVHAVLDDRNLGYWLATLEQADGHEIAFHYRTGRYNRWLEAARGGLGLRKRPARPDRRAIVDGGLLKQVRWAKRHRVGIATLHRHLEFLIYPEWIDAMHRVLEQEPEVLGSSSLFRGKVLRWGHTEVDGTVSTCGESPDSQFPYWFPFKLAHAALGGIPLRGWETTSVMEIEPELFDQLLAHEVPGLPQRVFTLNFHPAHARRPTFVAGGSLAWWRRILRTIRDRGIPVVTLRELYERLNSESHG